MPLLRALDRPPEAAGLDRGRDGGEAAAPERVNRARPVPGVTLARLDRSTPSPSPRRPSARPSCRSTSPTGRWLRMADRSVRSVSNRKRRRGRVSPPRRARWMSRGRDQQRFHERDRHDPRIGDLERSEDDAADRTPPPESMPPSLTADSCRERTQGRSSARRCWLVWWAVGGGACVAALRPAPRNSLPGLDGSCADLDLAEAIDRHARDLGEARQDLHRNELAPVLSRSRLRNTMIVRREAWLTFFKPRDGRLVRGQTEMALVGAHARVRLLPRGGRCWPSER